jgi:hypothetical protein
MRLVTRSAWKARPPKGVQRLRPTRGAAIHYSAANADEQANHRNCASRVRAIQNHHMDTNGWLDIAYSFLVCKHGFVFVGRGAHARTAANGTNAGNTGYLAICFLGDDTKGRDDVTDSGREALVDARRHLLEIHPHADETVGHRDITATECPGDQLYAYIHSAAFERAVQGKGWEPGDPIWQNLPGPSPKPRWFWNALNEMERRRKVQRRRRAARGRRP